MKKTTFFIAILTFATAGAVAAQSLEQRLGNQSWVDWRRFVVRASGSSEALVASQDREERIDALQTAKAAAAENLRQAVEKLTLDSGSTVEKQMSLNSLLKSKVRSFVKRFTVVDTRSMSDMTVEVEVELPLFEGFNELFLPDVTGAGTFRLDDVPRSPLSLLPWPECRLLPAGVELVIPSKGLTAYDGRSYTGLVVDARGLGVKPGLQPRILDPSGQEVYGLNYIPKEAATTTPVVTYHLTVNDALHDAHVGKVPFVVCADATEGALNADVVVSQNDAVLIHSAALTRNFLQDGRVVIVIGAKD